MRPKFQHTRETRKKRKTVDERHMTNDLVLQYCASHHIAVPIAQTKCMDICTTTCRGVNSACNGCLFWSFFPSVYPVNRDLMFDVFCFVSSFFLIPQTPPCLTTGWDRFLACARNPLFYNRNMSYRRSVLLIGVAWLAPAVILAPAVAQSPPGAPATDSIMWRADSVTSPAVAVVFAVANYLVPLLALTAIYTKVFCAARGSTASQARKNLVFEFDHNYMMTRRSLSAAAGFSAAKAAAAAAPGSRPPFSRQNSTSSFQSFITAQERQKAAHIIVWILVTFVALYSLYFVDVMMRAFWPGSPDRLPVSFHRAVHVMYFLGTVVNPIIYILCNSSLRKDIRRYGGPRMFTVFFCYE